VSDVDVYLLLSRVLVTIDEGWIGWLDLLTPYTFTQLGTWTTIGQQSFNWKLHVCARPYWALKERNYKQLRQSRWVTHYKDHCNCSTQKSCCFLTRRCLVTDPNNVHCSRSYRLATVSQLTHCSNCRLSINSFTKYSAYISTWTAQKTPFLCLLFPVVAMQPCLFAKLLLSNGRCIFGYLAVVAQKPVYMPQYLQYRRHWQNSTSWAGAFLSEFCQIASGSLDFAEVFFLQSKGVSLSPASNVEDQTTVFMSFSDSVVQLYPQVRGSLCVAFYNSQGDGGGILTNLHTGKVSGLYSVEWCDMVIGE
jgi:hypothetical protein